MSQPRPSTDRESAPLLRGTYDDNEGDERDLEGAGFVESFFAPMRRLTDLEKILASFGIFLLLLASVFVGLYAGSEKELEKARESGRVEWKTKTETWTQTETATKTSAAVTTTVTAVPTGVPPKKVCLSAECVQLSASILSQLNTTADPCDDFYSFAVGGWLNTHQIPADKGLYGAFNEVIDNNKKIMKKIVDEIPESLGSSVEEQNLGKLRDVYRSCLDVDTLSEVGIKPFLPLADFILDTIGPFDTQPSKLLALPQSWKGSYDEDSYAVPDELHDAAERLEAFQQLKAMNKVPPVDLSSPQYDEEQLELGWGTEGEKGGPKFDAERTGRITKTLAWLHSRDIGALINFAIEGDAGGEDSQIQSLWLYQAFGGLPAKEYYEEKPILDLYQSVVSDILIDIATHTDASLDRNGSKDGKRDLLSDAIEEMIEEAEGGVEGLVDEVVAGWPWPWPGDDKGGDGGGDGGDKGPSPGDPLEKRMDTLAGEVVAFERELLRAGAAPEYLYNPHYSYNPYSTSAVADALPFLDIPTYLSTFAIRLYPANITVTYPPYLKAVSRIVAETPDRVLSAYFVIRAALRWTDNLGPEVGMWQAKHKLDQVLKGVKKGAEEDRAEICLNWVDNLVGFIAGREFVREAFSPEAKAEGEHIIKSIVTAFHDKLPHISWMDAESAKAAQKKAESIIPKIGYPLYPNTTDPSSLASWYARAEISATDFFGNAVRSEVVDQSRAWSTLGRRRNRGSWEMYPQTVNAYYSPPDGEIVFPAGILQPPFYSIKYPSYMSYGAFGAVAAHELTHAFDNSGSQYDDKGRLRDWWSNATVQAFEERAQCIAKQYAKFFVYDDKGNKVHVNGNFTNGEDIADSGLAQAYAAWKSLPKSPSTSDDDAETLQLPGLDYTPDQLFFLAFARIWSQLTRPATAVARIRTDPHSPPYWRATGTLMNSAEFHKAFGCKPGSRMNPVKEDQCPLW